MRSEFRSSPREPSLSQRTPFVRTPSIRTPSRRTFRATCVARRGEAAPGPSCSPKSGGRSPASEKPSGFGQYIRPGLGLLDDAPHRAEFQAGSPSLPRATRGLPWSSLTPSYDRAPSSSTCIRPLPYSRWQLSTPTRREETKPLLQFAVHFGVAEFAILPLGADAWRGASATSSGLTRRCLPTAKNGGMGKKDSRVARHRGAVAKGETVRTGFVLV